MKFFRVRISPLITKDFETLKQAVSFAVANKLPEGAKLLKVTSSTDKETGAIHWKTKVLRRY